MRNEAPVAVGPVEVFARSPEATWARWLALSSVVVLAAGLRLWMIHDVPGNNFYDAAVRSMSRSWHAFFFGALEPSGSVSIDKPPVDLWLQVAATRLLGYGLTGLHLPEALSGVGACALLFGALRRAFGTPVGLLGALALAVLPISVLTARSDTMDSLLAALQIAALWLSWRALESRRMRWSLLAAAMMGVAFNVKLSEVLIAAPAMIGLWLWAAPAGARLRVLLGTLSTFVTVSLSWSLIASLTATTHRPYPVGSATGSIWRLIFLYNGLDRFTGHTMFALPSTSSSSGPGPLRLLSAAGPGYNVLIGGLLLSVLTLGPLALLTQGRERLRARIARPEGKLAVGIVAWFVCGLVVFSAMRRLEPRYLEAFAPAVCALFAIAVGTLVRQGRPWVDRALAAAALLLAGYEVMVNNTVGVWTVLSLIGLCTALVVALWRSRGAQHAAPGLGLLAAPLVIGLLATPVGSDLKLITENRSDSTIYDPTTPAMSRYLRAHRGGARFEVASANVDGVVGLVARDGLPVIMLNDLDGAIERVAKLKSQVADHQVRFYFSAHDCHAGPRCPANERWAHAHSTPVAGYPGLRRFSPAAR